MHSVDPFEKNILTELIKYRTGLDRKEFHSLSRKYPKPQKLVGSSVRPAIYFLPDMVFLGYLPYHSMRKERTFLTHSKSNYQQLLNTLCQSGNPHPLGISNYLNWDHEWLINNICARQDYRFSIVLHDGRIEVDNQSQFRIFGEIVFIIGATRFGTSIPAARYNLGLSRKTHVSLRLDNDILVLRMLYKFRIGKLVDWMGQKMFNVPPAANAWIKVKLTVNLHSKKVRLQSRHPAFPSVDLISNWNQLVKLHNCNFTDEESIEDFLIASRSNPSLERNDAPFHHPFTQDFDITYFELD